VGGGAVVDAGEMKWEPCTDILGCPLPDSALQGEECWRGAGVGHGEGLIYASPGDAGIFSVGDLYGAPAGAGGEVPFLGPASVLAGASASAEAEAPFLSPASVLYGASASMGAEVVLVLGPASSLSAASASAGA
jgi:hypothetical protein